MKLDRASPRTPGEYIFISMTGSRLPDMVLEHKSPRKLDRSFENYFLEKFDPWDLENRVQAELDLPRTKIDLSKGAIPNYGGYIPGLKYRFGESYSALSTQAKL